MNAKMYKSSELMHGAQMGWRVGVHVYWDP